MAVLGARLVRRHGLIRSRSFYLNETGDPDFDVAIEHNALLVDRSHQGATGDALIGWFAGHGTEADELHIGGSTQSLPEQSVEGRGLGRSETSVPAYSVELSRLSSSGGELAAILSSNARQQLRRAIRHFAASGPLQLTHATTLAEAHAYFSGLKELHIASWQSRGKPHSFRRGFFEQFHRRLIEHSFSDGVIELVKASAGSQIIGYLYNFRHADRVYAYQSGFAYDRVARPGAVTHALAIEDAYRSGAAVYDFLAGRNRLKESFATRCEPMLWHVIQQPRLAFRVEKLARGVKRGVEGQVANLLPQRKKMLLAQRQDGRGLAAPPRFPRGGLAHARNGH